MALGPTCYKRTEHKLMKFLCSVQETPVWRARLAFPARKKSKIEEFLEKKGKENAFVGPLCVTLLNKKSSVEYCQQKNGNLSKLSP